MRSVVAAALGLSLCGCATVAVVPSEATVSSEMTAEQSALHTASDIFCERAEVEGWVSTSPGILGFASILMNGARNDGEPVGTYADRIDAASDDVSATIDRIIADSAAASDGLMDVTAEAETLLASTELQPDRRDVTAYERALVRAQRANRSFEEAYEILSERTDETHSVRGSLDAFAVAIDRARRTADALNEQYADIDRRAQS